MGYFYFCGSNQQWSEKKNIPDCYVPVPRKASSNPRAAANAIDQKKPANGALRIIEPRRTGAGAKSRSVECLRATRDNSSARGANFSGIADCRDIYPLFHDVKGRRGTARTRLERDFYSHLDDVLADRGRYLKIEDHKTMVGLVDEFEYLTQSQSVSEGEADFLIKACSGGSFRRTRRSCS